MSCARWNVRIDPYRTSSGLTFLRRSQRDPYGVNAPVILQRKPERTFRQGDAVKFGVGNAPADGIRILDDDLVTA